MAAASVWLHLKEDLALTTIAWWLGAAADIPSRWHQAAVVDGKIFNGYAGSHRLVRAVVEGAACDGQNVNQREVGAAAVVPRV